MRVGIVGTGLNSSYHINFSRAYGGAEIVGVADTDFTRAQSCCQKYGITHAYPSVAELLKNPLDVLHVITPPRTHAAVVAEILEAGRHVLVEKPMALNAREACSLYELAEKRGATLCPVHNHLFDPCMRKADALVKSGALGKVINVESYYGLNTDIPAFRDYPRPNVLPWLYGLPGGVYQDFLPHPLYILLEYTGAPRDLKVMHRSTGVLPQHLPDEIRVLVDGEDAFGTVTFSFAAKPHLHFVRIYGTKMMVEVDFNTMTTVTHAVSSLPKAAQKATYNFAGSWQLARSTVSNMFRFATGHLKPYHGMMNLIHAFYESVQAGAPPPVSRTQALDVVKTMDAIFEQLHFEPLKHETLVARSEPTATSARILVTGGTGFLGRRLVTRLVSEGRRVRVLARKLADVDELRAAGVEIVWGDVADLASFEQAVMGCDVVVHLAAGTSGSEKDGKQGTLEGTANLIELSRKHKPSRVVYISSCSVYDIVKLQPDAVVAEDASLETFPERRGTYSASKQEAERRVAEYMKTGDVPVVILRPGTIYGPGGDVYTPMMGFALGSLYVVIGTGKFILPFVFVDNVVDAISKCIEKPEAEGQIFNVVDSEKFTKRDYMNAVIRQIDPKARVLYVPYRVIYGLTWFQEVVFGLMKRRPVLSRYRLVSSQKNVIYDNRKLVERLEWRPPVRAAEAMASLVRFQSTQ